MSGVALTGLVGWPAGALFLAGGMPWGVLMPVFLLAVGVGVWRGQKR